MDEVIDNQQALARAPRSMDTEKGKITPERDSRDLKYVRTIILLD